jgi:proteasome lid subunit RPN8/RPN11
MLRLAQGLIEQIQEHGSRDYPHECCGALLGCEEGSDRKVHGIMPLENRRSDSPNNRFSIEPKDVLRAEKEAAAKGWDLIGWYHSHPDSPAHPSDYDRDHAWPWYSYIIFQVEKAEPREMRSWRLDDNRTVFTEEAIEFVSSVPR